MNYSYNNEKEIETLSIDIIKYKMIFCISFAIKKMEKELII